MQDIRAALIAQLNGLSVTHNAHTFSLAAGYYSQFATLALPAVFVRAADAQTPLASIDGRVQDYDVHYDLAITCVSSDTLLGESFLTDAANAVQTSLRSVQTSLSGAIIVYVVGDRVLPPEEHQGTFLFQRVLTVRARSIETF